VPVLNNKFRKQLEAVAPLILSEVNVKEIEYLDNSAGVLVKKIKPNFKTLGPRYGKLMKAISSAISELSQEDIAIIEAESSYQLTVGDQQIELTSADVEILSEDIPGWLVATEGKLTVALDIKVSPELRQEGIAREFINRIQNLRKDSGLEVTDKISVRISRQNEISEAVENFSDFIGSQTLAGSVELVENVEGTNKIEVILDDEIKAWLQIEKI
jgi:isoleucyl-tRNA synthetase